MTRTPQGAAEDLAERLAEGVGGVVGGGEEPALEREIPAPRPGQQQQQQQQQQLERDDRKQDLPHSTCLDAASCRADSERESESTLPPPPPKYPPTWMPDRKIPLLPAPASSQLPTSEMRPRRKLLRLVIYSLIATGITTLMYSAYAQVFGPPSEPGLNLNSAKRLGYKQLENIPLRYIPREYDTDLKRLVFIGDVHGMYTELQELLEQINYDKHTDHIVLTGDLVTKGPDSLKVIDFGIENGVSCVRGNQDDRVLLHYLRNKARGSRPPDSLHQEEEDPSRKVSASEKQLWVEKALAKKLSKEQAAWLNSCPLILRADDVKGLGNVAIVHAGLIHGVPLDQQDPVAIMTMRSVHRRSRVPSSGTTGTHWARLWNRYEKHERVPLTVIYGHYAARGLDRRPLSQGLDSNCVRGGRLTALVASTRTDNPEVFSVHCRKAYSK